MRSYYHTINENNKANLNKPSDSDLVYYSELNSWQTNNAFRSFCLKYVIDQRIHYKIGNKEFKVDAGSFLLGCKQPLVNAYFDNKRTVKSICIDICPNTVSEAFTVLKQTPKPNLDNYSAGLFENAHFLETVSSLGSAPFASQLNQLATAIEGNNASELINREWFLELVEKIVLHEYGNYLALSGLRSVKAETRKEILRRLQIAKGFMDENFLHIAEVNEVARVCSMSEFHFFRSFRQAFGISPYQYLLKKRLHCARELIMSEAMSVTQIATHCNFPDVFTFSKAFKRQFNTAPTKYRLLAEQ